MTRPGRGRRAPDRGEPGLAFAAHGEGARRRNSSSLIESVDDGSSDGTRSVVDAYRARLHLRYYFQPDEGWRVSKARNIGITHARGDVCVFIDSGVLLHSGCLAAHIGIVRGANGPVGVSGYVYGLDVSGNDTEELERFIDVEDPDGTIERMAAQRKWLDLREEFYEKYGDDFGDLPAPWVVYWTCNVSAPTRLLRSVGMFDETFRGWGGEDPDIAYRMHRAGARFVLDRRASAIHYPHEKDFGTGEDAAAVNYRYMANKYQTPVTALLPLNPAIGPFNINDVIRRYEIPGCAEYLAQRRERERARTAIAATR